MFQGHGIYLNQGQHVMPPGSIANRLQAGQFGPGGARTAPPGFAVPPIGPGQLASALGRRPTLPVPPQAPMMPPIMPGMQQQPLPPEFGFGGDGSGFGGPGIAAGPGGMMGHI